MPKLSSSSTAAVLTGDIVNSSQMSAAIRRRLPELLRQLGRDLGTTWPQQVPTEISIFRGDAWQILVQPDLALHAVLFLRAGIIASGADEPIDTRISMAIGTIDFLPDLVAEGDGRAYRLSGQALDELREPFRLSLQGGKSHVAYPVVAPLLDTICQGWTARQAQAVQARLRGWSQHQISEKFQPEPITQQSVARHLAQAHWLAVERALEELEPSRHLRSKS